MPSSEALTPVRMRRVAVVAPYAALRETLVRVADAGCVELERLEEMGPGPAGRRLQRIRTPGREPVLAAAAPDLDALEREGRVELLAGEAQLEERLYSAVRRGEVAALAGWCPAAEVSRLGQRLAPIGGALVPLGAPRGVDPPTLLRGAQRPAGGFTPLVTTFGTVPYKDFDPSWPAGIVYVAMFGLMFGDVGHGGLLLLAALTLRLGRPRKLARWRRLWPFLAGAGAAGMLAGFAYGEFFGPTGLLPVLWLNPLDEPERLLAVSIGIGAVLLTLALAAGTVNRWREDGPGRALYAASGSAGLALLLGLGLGCWGLYLHHCPVVVAGAVLAAAGLALAGVGLFQGTAGGAAGAAETGVRLFDVVVRTGTNTLSFARLAAFGLTHAALADLVWRGTAGLADRGPGYLLAAVVVFVAGTAAAVALEALVAAVQALRLEFYEIFSRVFETEGRPFRPWHVRTAADAEVTS
ncbi:MULTISPECIES: V-type ATPase 116kDa subunit family protein [unclassified Streptomyces]|uniref:V-type ATPase 116kDa subunit family protein n=1 Tax=unclassified Streptomyces TaxID=2593676 RepID=UPI002E2B2D27|nr:V-type ATPase 116kDa subunit family protein [Streptomyces sp. NBC_01439]